MTDVRIRNVDDWVVESHRQQARRDGQTLEHELRELLTTVALSRKQVIADELRESLKPLRDKYGTLSDSSLFIREDRDSR